MKIELEPLPERLQNSDGTFTDNIYPFNASRLNPNKIVRNILREKLYGKKR